MPYRAPSWAYAIRLRSIQVNQGGRARLATAIIAWVLAGAIAAASAGAVPADGASAHPKRGIASARELTRDPAALARLGTAWAYDWSATPPPSSAVPWVPMVWGAGAVTPGVLQRLTQLRSRGVIRQLLTFNEPDSPTQANMTPIQAAALWPRLERTGLTLGSPAVADPSDGWLARFWSLVRARRLRVDFLALHVYQDVTDPAAVGELRSELVALHTRYRRPLWITEIGALNIAAWGEPMRHRLTAGAAVDYLRRLFAMLDALPFVQRYAWFTDACTSDPGCRDSSLVDAAGRATRIGRAFADAR